MLNIVIPMAGAGSRFKDAGYKLPKPFIDVNGKPMIVRVLDGLKTSGSSYTLIIQKSFLEEQSELLNLLKKEYNVKLSTVDGMTMGAACTALSVFRDINNDTPVLFADSDNIFNPHVVAGLIKTVKENKLDGALVTFPSSEPKFSFVKLDSNGVAVETKEKEAISTHAIAGIYYFNKGKDFVENCIDMLVANKAQKGEFYMSGVYNYLIQSGKRVGIYEISDVDWDCVGTPEQLKVFLDKKG